MSKLIDKNGKLFGKVSIIDLAVLGLVVLVFLGIGMRQSRMGQDVQIAHDIELNYTIEIANVRHWARHNIRAGDQIFTSNTHVGTIQEVSYRPYVATVSTDSGILQAEVPGRYVTYIRVAARATVNDGRVLVSHSIPLGAGNASVQFTTRYANFTGHILELNYEQ